MKTPKHQKRSRKLPAPTSVASSDLVGRPVEFYVKGSEWKKMPAKTKAALAEMVKCAAKMLRGPTCPRCASHRVQQIGLRRWHCVACQKRWSVRTPNDQAQRPGAKTYE